MLTDERLGQVGTQLAQRVGVELPITAQVHDILFAGKDPQRALRDLMLRTPKPEFWSRTRGVS